MLRSKPALQPQQRSRSSPLPGREPGERAGRGRDCRAGYLDVVPPPFSGVVLSCPTVGGHTVHHDHMNFCKQGCGRKSPDFRSACSNFHGCVCGSVASCVWSRHLQCPQSFSYRVFHPFCPSAPHQLPGSTYLCRHGKQSGSLDRAEDEGLGLGCGAGSAYADPLPGKQVAQGRMVSVAGSSAMMRHHHQRGPPPRPSQPTPSRP